MNNRQGFHSSIIDEALKCNIPHLDSVRAIMRLGWACAGGNMQLLIDSASTEALHKSLKDNESDDSDVSGDLPVNILKISSKIFANY